MIYAVVERSRSFKLLLSAPFTTKEVPMRTYLKAVELIRDAKADMKKKKRRKLSLFSKVRRAFDPDHRHATKRLQSKKSKALRRKSKHKPDYSKEY